MNKKLFVNILIGKEEEKLNISKERLKELDELFERCKPVLDRLGKKETTDQDIKDFIKLIEENHCKNCIFTIDFKLPEDYYSNDEYNEE